MAPVILYRTAVRSVWTRIAAAALACGGPMDRLAAADETQAQIELHYTVDALADIRGGVHRGNGVLGRLDLVANKSDGFAGIAGAEAHFDLMLLHGSRFSNRYAGDAQTLSNIDAPRAIRPFEAWIQIPFAGHFRAKVGLIDLNSEFDVQSVGIPFLNSSFGIAPDFSQSGSNGPSIFPVTSPGLIVAAEDGEHRTLAVGLFDALPGDPNHPHRFLPGPVGRDGALLVAEVGIPVHGSGEVQIGGWRYSDRFPKIDGRGLGTSGGVYALIQGTLAGDEKSTSLRGWTRVGFATSRVDRIGFFVGGGVTYGDRDRLLGLGVAHARLSDPALDAAYGNRRAETAIELMAYRRLGPLIAIEPDMQFIVHPSWQDDIPDALVLGLRLRLDWAPRAG